MLGPHLNSRKAPPSSTEQPTSLLAHQGILSYAHIVQNGTSKPWIVDSGASDHMTEDISILKNYRPCTSNSVVRIANGSFSPVAGTGSVQLSKDLHLYSVLYAPKLNCNLLTISQLTRDLNCVTKFYSNLCHFQEMDSGKVIGSAKMCGGLYLLKEIDKFTRQVVFLSLVQILSKLFLIRCLFSILLRVKSCYGIIALAVQILHKLKGCFHICLSIKNSIFINVKFVSLQNTQDMYILVCNTSLLILFPLFKVTSKKYKWGSVVCVIHR